MFVTDFLKKSTISVVFNFKLKKTTTKQKTKQNKTKQIWKRKKRL